MAIDQDALTALQNTLTAQRATWTAGRTIFFGLTDQELQRRLGYRPGPGEPTLQDRESQGSRQLLQHAAPAAGAPTSIDWRNIAGRNFISAIKDQSSCGSCVAFGTTATLDARIRVLKNLAVNDTNGEILTDLSEAQLFYCGNASDPNPCLDGWWPTGALDYCKSNGLSPEYSFPYTPGNQPCNVSANWQETVTALSAYHTDANVNDMKAWLSTNGPLITCFTVYEDFYSYTSGVYRQTSSTVEGGHCVSCIGYSDTLQAWLCKNSWGTSWGESGFFWIGYGQCGIDSTMWAADSFSRIFPVSGTVCHIESFFPGLVLDIRGANTARGTVVETWTQNNPASLNQLWVLTSDGHILSLLNGLVLDVTGGSTNRGTGVQTWTQNNPTSPNQTWTLASDAHINSGIPNLVLDITGGSTTPGTPVETWTKNSPDSPNQLWKLALLQGV
jgi:Papain family cysteine protease/Ricin-type beta-trefoil lectin domain